jgi:hypothetical protein
MEKYNPLNMLSRHVIFVNLTVVRKYLIKKENIFLIDFGAFQIMKSNGCLSVNMPSVVQKRMTTDSYSKRNFSVTYTLPLDLDKSSPRSVKVCKTMFKNTLSISNQFIYSALDKYDKDTGNCLKDLRGYHENKNKINTATVIQGVCDHVKSFQPVESHCIRKDSNKLTVW